MLSDSTGVSFLYSRVEVAQQLLQRTIDLEPSIAGVCGGVDAYGMTKMSNSRVTGLMMKQWS